MYETRRDRKPEMRERGMNVPELPTRIKIENGTAVS
jgi:hypothetical protein